MIHERRAPPTSPLFLLRQTLDGNRRALSRLISLAEDDPEKLDEALAVAHLKAGRALSIGITGFPGSGKSTLVDKLIAAFRAAGKTVAVLAVDPSSPFSGGAVLGDRIRMQHAAGDPGVFIRSLGSRGHLGGVSRSTRDVMKILDAFGFDLIVVETVGTGQSEIEVVRLVDSCVVVLVPGLGDDIQALKAGILEIADLFVVNKRDHQGAERTKMEIESMLDMSRPGACPSQQAAWDAHHGAMPVTVAAPAAAPLAPAAAGPAAWRPPVVLTQANANLGIDDLVGEVARHQEALRLTRELTARRRRRCRDELLEQMTWALRRRAEQALAAPEAESVVQCLEQRVCSPGRAARSILAREWAMSNVITEGGSHVRPIV